jgi:hypothetical protein
MRSNHGNEKKVLSRTTPENLDAFLKRALKYRNVLSRAEQRKKVMDSNSDVLVRTRETEDSSSSRPFDIL